MFSMWPNTYWAPVELLSHSTLWVAHLKNCSLGSRKLSFLSVFFLGFWLGARWAGVSKTTSCGCCSECNSPGAPKPAGTYKSCCTVDCNDNEAILQTIPYHWKETGNQAKELSVLTSRPAIWGWKWVCKVSKSPVLSKTLLLPNFQDVLFCEQS